MNAQIEFSNHQSKIQSAQNNQLTQTKIMNTQAIRNHLYEIAKYFYIADELDFSTIQQQFKKKLKWQICCFQTVQKSKSEIMSSDFSVVICSVRKILEVVYVFQQEIKNCKIVQIVMYGDWSNWRKCFKQDIARIICNQYTIQKVISNFRKNGSYLKQRQFSNFLMLSRQTLLQNIPLKTLYSMRYQQTNRLQILQKFVQLQNTSAGIKREQQIKQFLMDYQKGCLGIEKIIDWYTRQSFLYRLLNKVLRSSQDPSISFITQPVFRDLFNAIKQLHTKQKGQSKFKKFKCYRGGSITQTELQMFKNSINCIVQNLGFMSTSLVQRIGNAFATNVIFQIEVDDSQRRQLLDYGWAFLEQYSSRKGEYEVLFNHLNTFKIISVQLVNHLYIIKLRYGQLAEMMNNDESELAQEQVKYLRLVKQLVLKGQQQMSKINVPTQDSTCLKGSNQSMNKFLKLAQQSLISYNQDEMTPTGDDDNINFF